jgi:mRNA interferase RelE/StbE
LSTEFRIAETATFQKKITSLPYRQDYDKIKGTIYPKLRTSPFFGPNIKKLKGELAGLFRYRIGTYRLLYTIDSGKNLVFMLDILHRKDAYR